MRRCSVGSDSGKKAEGNATDLQLNWRSGDIDQAKRNKLASGDRILYLESRKIGGYLVSFRMGSAFSIDFSDPELSEAGIGSVAI